MGGKIKKKGKKGEGKGKRGKREMGIGEKGKGEGKMGKGIGARGKGKGEEKFNKNQYQKCFNKKSQGVALKLAFLGHQNALLYYLNPNLFFKVCF